MKITLIVDFFNELQGSLNYDALGSPDVSIIKNPLANAEEMGSIPGSGRSPGEGNGKPLYYSCLGNPVDRGTWWATVHEVTKESDRI